MTIGERIRVIRKGAKMNLDDFGAKIGVTGPAVSMMENGKASVTDRSIKAICREFNVNERWLRTGEGPMKAPESPPDELDALLDRYKLPRRLRGLFIRYGKLPEASQAAIREWLDGWILDAADGIRAEQDAAAPRNVHDWTPDEMRAELNRQLADEEADRKKGTTESSTGSPNESGADCA